LREVAKQEHSQRHTHDESGGLHATESLARTGNTLQEKSSFGTTVEKYYSTFLGIGVLWFLCRTGVAARGGFVRNCRCEEVDDTLVFAATIGLGLAYLIDPSGTMEGNTAVFG
jgi:hypothetical protein